jgi:hypothetical protein
MQNSLSAIRAPSQAYIAALSDIADWKDALRAKIAAALDEFESSLDPGDIDSLRDEVDRFTLTCRSFRR